MEQELKGPMDSSNLKVDQSTSSTKNSEPITVVQNQPRKRRGSDSKIEETEMSPVVTTTVDRRIPISLEQHVDMVLNAKKTEYICQDPSCNKTFMYLDAYNEHYSLRHMYKCAECRKSLPGSYFLELHVLETHDTLFSLMAQKKPMYACLAEECPEKFNTPDERYEHFHVFHKKHPLFWTFKHFENISGNVHHPHKSKGQQKNKNKNKAKSSVTEVTMEIDAEQQQTEQSHSSSEMQQGQEGSSDQNTTGKKTSPKPKMQIQFGHRGAKFKSSSWHSAGGQKVNISSEKIMDLSSIESVLEGSKVKPNPEEIMDLSAVEKALENGPGSKESSAAIETDP